MVKVETFKMYIKINMANHLIRALKLLADILILCIQNFYYSFCLYVNTKDSITLELKTNICYL